MKQVRLIRRSTVYRGRIIHLVQELLEIRGRRMIRETIRHPGAVVIVPLLDRSRLVFVRQYRRAVDRELLELPAGTLGAGERRAACARPGFRERRAGEAGTTPRQRSGRRRKCRPTLKLEAAQEVV